MNCLLICGTVSQEPKLTVDTEKMKIAKFSVAVQRPRIVNGKREVDFFDVSAFGKNAEFAMNYIKKGSKVVVRGQIESDKYTNKEGQTVKDWEVKAAEIDFAANKEQQEEAIKADEKRHAEWKEKEKQKAAEAAAKPEAEPKQETFMDIPEDLDDLPFN